MVSKSGVLTARQDEVKEIAKNCTSSQQLSGVGLGKFPHILTRITLGTIAYKTQTQYMSMVCARKRLITTFWPPLEYFNRISTDGCECMRVFQAVRRE